MEITLIAYYFITWLTTKCVLFWVENQRISVISYVKMSLQFYSLKVTVAFI